MGARNQNITSIEQIDDIISSLDLSPISNTNIKRLMQNIDYLNKEEKQILLDAAYAHLTISFCIAKLNGEVQQDLMYSANDLKKLIESLK